MVNRQVPRGVTLSRLSHATVWCLSSAPWSVVVRGHHAWKQGRRARQKDAVDKSSVILTMNDGMARFWFVHPGCADREHSLAGTRATAPLMGTIHLQPHCRRTEQLLLRTHRASCC